MYTFVTNQRTDVIPSPGIHLYVPSQGEVAVPTSRPAAVKGDRIVVVPNAKRLEELGAAEITAPSSKIEIREI